jgi:hypothetical protein
MTLLRPILGIALALSAAAAAIGPSAPSLPPNVRIPAMEGGFPEPQVIEGVPTFREQSLRLVGLPKASGRRFRLFNGRDLGEFTAWLGYANGSLFPSGPDDKPLGETGIGDVFSVVEEEGKPAIYITGRIWGAIITKRDLGNYHLSLGYKFGKQWNPEVAPNSGVLYHSYGPYGAFAATFMSSVEFEVAKGLTGMAATIGRGITAEVELGEGPGPGLFGGPDLRYMPGGKRTQIRLPTIVKQQRDVELPAGQWNRLDLYVAGDQAVQVVNGVPTMALSAIALKGEDGIVRPLTHGRIQFESEGTEVYMRDIWIEPISSVPRVVVVK